MKPSLEGKGVEFGPIRHDEAAAIWLAFASRNLRYSARMVSIASGPVLSYMSTRSNRRHDRQCLLLQHALLDVRELVFTRIRHCNSPAFSTLGEL